MVELAAGTTFAGYRIGDRVGRGGMGVVYRARHLALQRDDALKVIAPEFAEDLAFRARFEREWRVAAMIRHPHVIQVYDAGEEDGMLYLAMEFVEGTDLRAQLAMSGCFEVDRAVNVVSQVASALDAAHRHGLVHRDVKPANVLLDEREDGDYVYLTDFGLTKHLESRGRETRTGMFVGTTDYIAPEQVTGGELSPRADVYALGCVLYHLLAGRVPYPRSNDIATATAHVNEPPPSLAELRPELAARFDPVVAVAMAKEPSKRYASAGQLAEAAAAAARGSAASATQQRGDLHQTVPDTTPAPGWYAEPGTGRTRYWTGTGWGEYAETTRAPGWYPDPATGRTRWWNGMEWGPYREEERSGRKHRWRWIAAAVAVLVAGGAVAAALSSGTPKPGPSTTGSTTTGSTTTGSTTTGSTTTGSTTTTAATPLGPQLTATQLAAVVVPQSAYQKLLPDFYPDLQMDSSNYSLQGGIPSLKLCSATIPAPGLGADSSSSYLSIPYGVRPTIYFGSDAASFAGQGAEQFLSAAAAQATTCGWRSLPGAQLDDHVVRLTTDQMGPDNVTLHDDVILVRSGAAVVEVSSATGSGSHSTDAETLAEGAARRLAQAEHGTAS